MFETAHQWAGWGLFLAAGLGILGHYIGKRLEWYHERAQVNSAEWSRERQAVVASYAALVAALQTQVNEAQSDLQQLRAEIKTMQEALEVCERSHREDADKIYELQAENREQARRILDLERRVPGIDSDYTGQ